MIEATWWPLVEIIIFCHQTADANSVYSSHELIAPRIFFSQIHGLIVGKPTPQEQSRVRELRPLSVLLPELGSPASTRNRPDTASCGQPAKFSCRYVVHNPASAEGFGDWQFLVKYRIATGNEQHGNYILTAFFQMSFPTGQYTRRV